MTGRWTLAAVLLYAAVGVRSQSSNTTCAHDASTAWLFSSEGASPCLVWSRIQSLCLAQDAYINVPPLLPAYGYNSPQNPGLACQCNVVSYALMAGCSWCQVGDTNSWLSEADWKAGCDTYIEDGLGFEESVVVIPAFAWRPWQGSRWAALPASSSASSYSTLRPTGTTSLSRSLPPITSAPFTSTLTSPSNSASSRSASPSTSAAAADPPESESSPAKKWGPIVGGVAGGIFALVLLFFLIRWMRSRNQGQNGARGKPVVRYRGDEDDREKSFLGMFGAKPRGSMMGGERSTRGKRRETDLITDPLAFTTPRQAPKTPGDVNSMRYTTTQSRIRDRMSSDSDGSSIFDPRRNLPSHQNLGSRSELIVDMDEDDSLSSGRTGLGGGAKAQYERAGESSARRIAPSRSQDFTQPRPFSEVRTLPSLYDPPTGAARYTVTSQYTEGTPDGRGRELLGSTIMSSPMPLSPESRYPGTERGDRASRMSRGTIGEALGSGRGRDRESEQFWSRQKLPPLPRGVSDESRTG